ncbi:MAG: SMP-30/gluconolactonase/LRE family protein, partial [Terriglobia bacterium]
GTPVHLIKDLFHSTESPIAMPDGSVLFTEQDNGDGRIVRIGLDDGISTFVDNTNRTIGLAYDTKGRLVAAESHLGRIGVLSPTKQTLVDTVDGLPVVSPNDLVADRKGGIYFTDPYQVGAQKKPEDLPQAIYYISPDGKKVTQMITDIARPNGITLSANGKILYANDWDGAYLLTYDVQSDGTLKNRKNWGKYTVKQETDHGLVSGADGLCVDSKGDAFATTPAGVQVFNSKGEHLADIEAPYDMPPQNCGFGGPGYGYLYVTGRGVVYRIKTLTAGIKNQGK